MLGGGAACLRAAVCVQRMEKLKQAALDKEGIPRRLLHAGPVRKVQRSRGLLIKRRPRCDGAGEREGAILQGTDHMGAAPVVLIGAVEDGEREDDVLVLHPNPRRPLDRVELAGQDRDDGAGTDGEGGQVDGDRAGTAPLATLQGSIRIPPISAMVLVKNQT